MISRMERPTPYRNRDGEKSNDITPLDNVTMPVRRCLRNMRYRIESASRMAEQNERDAYVRTLMQCLGFRKFEDRLRKYVGPSGLQCYDSAINYISALLILDQLDGALNACSITFPNRISALDVGCGRTWYYADGLYSFLQNYGTDKPRMVKLRGIDLLANGKDIEHFAKRMKDRDAQMMKGDVMRMNEEEVYGFILLENMLTSANHFREWGLKPTNLDELIAKCRKLLSPSGVQVTIGYHSAGEYSNLVRHIPLAIRVGEFNNILDLGDSKLNDLFTCGFDRLFNTGICVSRK